MNLFGMQPVVLVQVVDVFFTFFGFCCGDCSQCGRRARVAHMRSWHGLREAQRGGGRGLRAGVRRERASRSRRIAVRRGAIGKLHIRIMCNEGRAIHDHFQKRYYKRTTVMTTTMDRSTARTGARLPLYAQWNGCVAGERVLHYAQYFFPFSFPAGRIERVRATSWKKKQSGASYRVWTCVRPVAFVER